MLPFGEEYSFRSEMLLVSRVLLGVESSLSFRRCLGDALRPLDTYSRFEKLPAPKPESMLMFIAT